MKDFVNPFKMTLFYPILNIIRIIIINTLKYSIFKLKNKIIYIINKFFFSILIKMNK